MSNTKDPLVADEEEGLRRQQWAMWLETQLLRAGYAAKRPDGHIVYWYTSLAAASGIPKTTLAGYVTNAAQPSPANATALARVLGLHPLAMWYHAGLLTLGEVQEFVGGNWPALSELRAALAEIDRLSEAGRPRALRDVTERTLIFLEGLQRLLNLSPEEFELIAAGGLQPDERSAAPRPDAKKDSSS